MTSPKAVNIAKHSLIRIGSLILLMSFMQSAVAQNRIYAYLITFDSKTMSESTLPLSELSLQKRAQKHIPDRFEDYAVNAVFIDSICQDSTIGLRYSLKWKNGIVVQSEKKDLSYLKHFGFVRDIHSVGQTKANQAETIEPHEILSFVKNTEINCRQLSNADYGKSLNQLEQVGIKRLHRSGFDGKGVRVAVFDAGFMNVDKLHSFARARGNRQLHTGYDLVDLDNDPISSDNHGTAVSSCMISFDPGKYIGGAPQATYYLFRTENGSNEDPLEELNWCKAAEIADSLGVDLVTSSLGYTQFDSSAYNYSHDQLTGHSSYIAEAARQLVERGILVVNSAGNERDDPWKKIGTPADVPEVLTVGAVDRKGRIGSFSSEGNNANGHIKPDVCAMGVKVYVSSTYGSYYGGYGTSYSTPVISGGVSCLLQAHPGLPPQQVNEAIRQTARNNATPDSLYGYGIANLYAAHKLLSINDTSQPAILDSSELLIYNASFDQIAYSIYTKKRFLFFFKRLHKVDEGELYSITRATYLPTDELSSKCSKKYTIKVKLKNRVEKHRLRINDLSLCKP